MGRKGKKRGGESGTAATASGTSASESSARHVDKSKETDSDIQEGKQSKKNVTKDQKSKIKGKGEATGDAQSAMPSTSKETVDKNIEKTIESTDNPTGDNEAASKFTESVTTKMDLCSKGKEARFETTPDLSKSEMARAVAELENAVSKTSRSTDMCFLTCEPPIPANTTFITLSELLQLPKVKDADEQKSNLNLKGSKTQHERALEKEKKVIEPILAVNESRPTLQCAEGTDKPKSNSDHLKALEVQQELFAEIESIILNTEPDTDVNEFASFFQCPNDIDMRKRCMNLNTSEVQHDITLKQKMKKMEPKCEVIEFIPTLQASEIMHIDERIRKWDLNVSNVKDLSSESLNELSEEEEEIVNLERDVNLCFEFDNLGNKKILVDDEVSYAVNEKKKMTFDIGGGNAKLSFLGNNVFIVTQESKIDCSIQRNQVTFSITDRTAQLDPVSEDLNASKLSESKDIAVVKDLDTSDIAGVVEDDSIIPSEMCPKSDTENVCMLTSKTVSSSAENSLEACKGLRGLQSITENFLTSVKTSCENFESSFLKSLKERSEDTHMK